MKKFILLLLLIPGLSFAQEEIMDLGIDGKDLNNIQWKDEVLVIEASLGKSILNQKGKHYEAKIFNLEKGEVLNSFASEKGTEIDQFNSQGNFVLSDPMGVIINPFGGNSSTPKFIGLEGNVLGAAKVDDDDVYIDETGRLYLTQDNLVFVAPLKKGYNGKGKISVDKPTQWVISKLGINSQKQETSKFTPTPFEGKVRVEGYSLLDVKDDKFLLLSKQFKNTNDGKEPNIQILKVSTFDLKGGLLKETELQIEIDNSILFYAEAGLKYGYDIVRPGSVSVRYPKSPATGTVYVDGKNEFYYVLSILAGHKNKTGMFLHFSKFDFEGNQLWNYQRKFLEKTSNETRIKYMNFDPIILDDRVLFYDRQDERDETVIFELDAATGKETKKATYDNIKGNYRTSKNFRQQIGGLYLKNELPKTVMMNRPSLIHYSMDERVKTYIKSLASEEEAVISTHITTNGTIFMLQANYKDKKYKLLKFPAQ